MKILFKYSLLLALVTVLSTGCQKAVQNAIDNTVATQINTILQNGYWTITRYSEGKNDSTAIFKDWRTYFNNNNALLSLKDSLGHFVDSTTGTWSSNDLSHFICTYSTGVKHPLTKISDTWNIDLVNTNLANKVGLFRTINGRPDTLQMIKN